MNRPQRMRNLHLIRHATPPRCFASQNSVVACDLVLPLEKAFFTVACDIVLSPEKALDRRGRGVPTSEVRLMVIDVTFDTASLMNCFSLSLSLTRNPAPSKMEPPSQALCASSPKGRAKRRRATKGRPYGVWIR